MAMCNAMNCALPMKPMCLQSSIGGKHSGARRREPQHPAYGWFSIQSQIRMKQREVKCELLMKTISLQSIQKASDQERPNETTDQTKNERIKDWVWTWRQPWNICRFLSSFSQVVFLFFYLQFFKLMRGCAFPCLSAMKDWVWVWQTWRDLCFFNWLTFASDEEELFKKNKTAIMSR